MRRKIFEIIEKADGNNKASLVYDIFMIIVIITSLIPLAFKNAPQFFVWLEWITTAIFIIDYILRWATADFKVGKGKKSFILYPVTAMAIIDILSILPSILMINETLRVLKVFRFIRALRVFRLFKGFRYSKNVEIIVKKSF